MASAAPRRRLHQFLLWLIVALAMLAASPASADAQLISVWPAVGSKLGTAPSEVVLTFSEAFKPDRLEVRVLNSQGKVVSKGKPAIAGPAVSQALHIGGRHHRRDRHFAALWAALALSRGGTGGQHRN